MSASPAEGPTHAEPRHTPKPAEAPSLSDQSDVLPSVGVDGPVLAAAPIATRRQMLSQLQRRAGNAAVQRLLVQRQPPAAPPAPAGPAGAAVTHEGVSLTADNAALRTVLEQRVATKGWDDTYGWATRFINMSPEQVVGAQVSARVDPQVFADIQKKLNAEIDRFQTDVQNYVKDFAPKAEGVAREILQNSEDQIKDQLKKLGVHEDTLLGIGLGTHSMDTGKGKQLQATAKELAARRLDANKVDIEFFKARDEINDLVNKSSAPGLTAVIPALVAPQDKLDRVEQLRNAALKAEDEYFNLCKAREQDNPILAAYTTGSDAYDRLNELASKSTDDLAEEVTQVAQERLDNIKEVRDQLGGRFVIWKQANILKISKQKENATPWQTRVVDDHASQVQADEGSDKKLLAALAIGLGLLAAIPTGGSSVIAGIAVAAAVSGAAITLYGAYEKLQEYTLESAAEATDFDKAKAISQGEPPELIWLAMDVVAAIADIKAAATAFKSLAELIEAARAAKKAESTAELMEAGPRFGLSADAQARLSASVTGAGATGDVAIQADAVHAAFLKADMTKVADQIEKVAGKGFRKVFDRLSADGSVHPLTEEALESVLGNKRASEFIVNQKALTWNGFYDPRTGHMFVKPGSLEFVSSTVIHESIHYVQASFGQSVTGFMAEFEAYTAERLFLQRLARDPNAKIPDQLKWLLNADDNAISIHISGPPYNYTIPGDIDSSEAVLNVIRRMQRF